MMNIKYISTLGYDFYCNPCPTVSGVAGGYIDVEQSWQMLSLPVKFGWWNSVTHKHVHDDITPATVYNYIIVQIEDIYGVNCNTMLEVCNSLVGGQGNYWNFVPGVINPLSPHNFQLSYLDPNVGDYEYTGFFIKSIHSTSFTIQWGDV